MIRPIKQPRRIDPSLVEVGDDVSVELPTDRGITTTLRGIVKSVVRSNATNYYMTEEGATLFAHTPGHVNKIKVTLFARDDVPQTAMFELTEEIKERLAS